LNLAGQALHEQKESGEYGKDHSEQSAFSIKQEQSTPLLLRGWTGLIMAMTAVLVIVFFSFFLALLMTAMFPVVIMAGTAERSSAE
jgi:hypothetical protein